MPGLTLPETRLVDHIAPQPIRDHVLDWAGVNSGTDNLAGLAAMAGRLADAFSVLPGEVSLLDPAPVAMVDGQGHMVDRAHGRHLHVSVRPDAARRILLTGHMDTVFAADHPFQHCTWLDEGTLRGPGTADMKGGIALMLAALQAFERMGAGSPPALGYDVLINSDEETGSLASARALRELAEGKCAALTYEPALPGGDLAKDRPGSGNFTAVIRGRSAHAGRNPEDGRNALVAAGDLALRLYRARRAGLAINPAKIDGGGPNNLVPDLAVLRFNMRPADDHAMAAARALIARAIDDVARDHDVAVALHGDFGRPPKRGDGGTGALATLVSAAARDLGLAMGWRDTGGVCDGNNIAACGVPVIDTMGACGGNIHTDEEFLLVDSLRERAQLSALVLSQLDRGEAVL
ncbi:peptidase M20 family protein [Caenibius tardaugens NBRC 16725]|uniref:Peptidase M20 family protein n=1 Tax=Caenibius tardaugens NBRC 16725 TaxID=1219035 RepID=U2Y9N8_9SPHN|nr:hydrolase [Caenibius tardaugens]AZI35666.1 hydrolase [Caenibius tardaugens NBRC 16725]GAD50046.1 peptidase M20 family protein [Caenibius tardaugens NBRC 16725]